MNFIFQAGGALPANYPIYIERTADGDALRAALRGDYLHIIAPRQVGKTSLLNHLAARLQQMGWRCAYVDLSLLQDLPKQAWYTRLGELLAPRLTPGQIPTLIDQFDLRSYLLYQALPWVDGQPRIALILDEVESTATLRDTDGSSFSDTFFMTLRSLYNERYSYTGTLVVALAGAVNPNNLVQNPAISPFNVGQEIELKDLTFPETKMLTEQLMKLGIPVNKAVHRVIHAWTSGHPYLTQRICFEIERLAQGHHMEVIVQDRIHEMVAHLFVKPDNPLGDKNIRHVAKKLARLSTMADKVWSQLLTDQRVLRQKVPNEIEIELYLTGAVKSEGDELLIANRIYEEVFKARRTKPDQLTDLRQNLLAHFGPNDQKIMTTVIQPLDPSQLVTVQSVLDAIEAKKVSDSELQAVLSAIQHTLVEIREQLSLPTWLSEVEHVSEVVDAGQLDLRHRVKFTIPIIPLLLWYENEIELQSGLNLEAAWQQLVSIVRGE